MSSRLFQGLVALAAASSLAVSAARADFLDPVGDTFGTGPVQIDIISVDGVVSGSSVMFSAQFANLILPASAGAANSLYAFIDLDTDRDPSTGAIPFQNGFGVPPDVALGDEFFIDLSSERFTPGFADVVDAVGLVVIGSVPIVYTPTSFSVTVPLSLLGSDGLMNFGLIVGTADEATDEAPNGTVPYTTRSVPEPAGSLLLGIGAISLAIYDRHRRRTTLP